MINKSRIGFFTPSIGLENGDECLEFVKARGGLIQGWTLPSTVAHEIKPGLDAATIISEVKKSKIKVSSLSGYMDWTLAEDNELRREELKKIIRQCKECDCNIICTETGRNYQSIDDKRAWQQLVDSMKYLCNEAEKGNIYVAIEMGRADLIFGVELFKKLQDKVQSTQLKVNFDPANLVRGGIDPLKAAEELKNDTVQVHLKDAVAEGMRQLTKGSIDFKALIEIFENNSYQGNYIIEAEYQSANMAEAVANDYKDILNLLNL